MRTDTQGAAFAHACKLGLEGIVSKRHDLPYRSGRCRAWIKVRNSASPAALRIIEEGELPRTGAYRAEPYMNIPCAAELSRAAGHCGTPSLMA